MKTSSCWLVVALISSLGGAAQADPIFGTNDPPADRDAGPRRDPRARRADSEAWRPGFGARIGGYGFRDPDGGVAWDACRMNGFGVFGTLDVNKYLYGELSADFYAATPAVVSQGLDRTSTHALTGVGLRMLPDLFITPFVVVGGGAEYTRVQMPAGKVDAVYPMGYIGLGGDLNVTRELKLGATVRMLATTRPTFASTRDGGSLYGASSEAALTGQGSTEAEMQFDIASQAQFFVRYAL